MGRRHFAPLGLESFWDGRGYKHGAPTELGLGCFDAGSSQRPVPREGSNMNRRGLQPTVSGGEWAWIEAIKRWTGAAVLWGTSSRPHDWFLSWVPAK